jgi:hypothetical protein
MTVLRLKNGSDTVIKLSVEETLRALEGKVGPSGFVDLPGEEGAIYVRPDSVIALFADSRRNHAGFRIGVGTTAS